MIERRKVKVFRTWVHFAICHDCQTWVKATDGQFGWIHPASRNRAVAKHREVAHA